MANISHGRGGAGNIEPDTKEYADAGIVREGHVGDQGAGPFSTGRGGAGNVGSPHTKATKGVPHDEDVIPENALRDGHVKDYHIGRGGAGNEQHDHPKAEHEHEGLADKLKHKLGKQ